MSDKLLNFSVLVVMEKYGHLEINHSIVAAKSKPEALGLIMEEIGKNPSLKGFSLGATDVLQCPE